MRYRKALGFLAALWAAFLLLDEAHAQGVPICRSVARAHVSTISDTQLVAAVAGLNIYVCDVEISWAGTTNVFLEKSSTGTCGTPTQIGIQYAGVAATQKPHANAFYSGLSTGVGQQLCVNNSAAAAVDIAVYYDQVTP